MGSKRKLNAMLFELQAAQSPLAQAKIIARAWRTVRELSPTDRKLLARHAGFDGAEEVLDGLATHRGGFAPAMLLQMLSKARATDGQSVGRVIAALRDPERRQETIARGFDMASELLVRPEAPEDEELVEALSELQAVEDSLAETPEEALMALNKLDALVEAEEDGRSLEELPLASSDSEPVEAQTEEVAPSPPVIPTDMAAPGPPIQPPPLPPPQTPTRSKEIDWERWDMNPGGSQSTTDYPVEIPRPQKTPGPRRFDAKTVMGALGAESSVFSQLRVLHRELAGFAGSSVETLAEVLEGFPDGWARRRALSALIKAGIPTDARDAIMLIAALENERDRSWCLGTLARRGDLRGPTLKQALDLVSSNFAKRRLEDAAEDGASASRLSTSGGQSLVP